MIFQRHGSPGLLGFGRMVSRSRRVLRPRGSGRDLNPLAGVADDPDRNRAGEAHVLHGRSDGDNRGVLDDRQTADRPTAAAPPASMTASTSSEPSSAPSIFGCMVGSQMPVRLDGARTSGVGSGDAAWVGASPLVSGPGFPSVDRAAGHQGRRQGRGHRGAPVARREGRREVSRRRASPRSRPPGCSPGPSRTRRWAPGPARSPRYRRCAVGRRRCWPPPPKWDRLPPPRSPATASCHRG